MRFSAVGLTRCPPAPEVCVCLMIVAEQRDAADSAVRALGIDLRSGPRYPTGVALLDGRLSVRWLATARADEELLAAVERFRPAIVAIDAPLGLPEGRCCAN